MGRFVESFTDELTAQWIERTSGKPRSTSTKRSRSNFSPAAVTSCTIAWPVLRPSRTTRWRR